MNTPQLTQHTRPTHPRTRHIRKKEIIIKPKIPTRRQLHLNHTRRIRPTPITHHNNKLRHTTNRHRTQRRNTNHQITTNGTAEAIRATIISCKSARSQRALLAGQRTVGRCTTPRDEVRGETATRVAPRNTATSPKRSIHSELTSDPSSNISAPPWPTTNPYLPGAEQRPDYGGRDDHKRCLIDA